MGTGEANIAKMRQVDEVFHEVGFKGVREAFFGDPAYDATQHLFNCRARLRADADGTIGRIAELLSVDRERVRLWMFARLAAEPRGHWQDDSMELARAIAEVKF